MMISISSDHYAPTTTVETLEDKLVRAHVDITAPRGVEVAYSADRKVLWVNVDGICVLRCCRIEDLKVVAG